MKLAQGNPRLANTSQEPTRWKVSGVAGGLLLTSHGLDLLMSCKSMSELLEGAASPSAAKPQLIPRHDFSKGHKSE